MPLTALACKNAKPGEKPQKLSDSGGLFLHVMPSGARYWRLKYRHMGKEKLLALGVYPVVSLEAARHARDEAKRHLAKGVDPGAMKKHAKAAKLTASESSFEKIALEWFEARKAEWVPHHAANVLKRLERELFPFIGETPIRDIHASTLLEVVRRVETRGASDVARRTLQTAGHVFRFAVATGRTDRDPSGDLKGALKSSKLRHHAHLKEADLPEYLGKLDAYDGSDLTKLALRFLLLTYVRSGELRGATWSEIDLKKKEWRIPAERMKMRETHIVPLCPQAIGVLEQVRAISGEREYIFPNQHQPRKHMSENTLLFALYRMGYHGRATAHGFRSTASTILNEHGFRADVIERQLAHGERNQVRASYNHAQYLAERREMMAWWGDFIDGIER